ncbi:hypothetical protein PV733_14995 [Streptomyces europaeiscabiei]|nr:hypothetical protein [Streptomyces europaeiscabiei]MDX3710254.1 hypothetical protein [Streptomyces europaeiscabiei]MDX3847211.1 hypothetical protein [Streptomyces europaeiscabiei]
MHGGIGLVRSPQLTWSLTSNGAFFFAAIACTLVCYRRLTK